MISTLELQLLQSLRKDPERGPVVLAFFLAWLPDASPSSVHDALNSLIQSGDLQLDAAGRYRLPGNS